MPGKTAAEMEIPLWLQLNKVSRKCMEALTARLGHLGITRHYFLVAAIGAGRGSLTQQQLADLLDTDKVTMVGILDYLAKAGFVRRIPGRTDRRERLIVLTPKAEKALPEIKQVIAALSQRALAGLPKEFARGFPEALTRMKAELEKAAGEARLAQAGRVARPAKTRPGISRL
ncbi:MAG TPA: MarR family transcriptional regulator [Fibrobacteria bacterium]|nr:MarR family transcriptional regulator [Fibrobacteria bacterium]